MLMILRGPENLHKCAWIGEEDSVEILPQNLPTADDMANLRVASDADSDEDEDLQTNRFIGSRIFSADDQHLKISSSAPDDLTDLTPSGTLTSVERKGLMNSLIKKALSFSKGKDELMDLLTTHHGIQPKNSSNVLTDTNNATKISLSKNGNEETENRESPQSDQNENLTGKSRFERSLTEDDHDGAFEVLDVDYNTNLHVKKFTRQEIDGEQIVGGLDIPEGLTYERGFVNQSNGFDLSREEHRSSYSSSEEALASCDGVILALPLQPDSQCRGFDRQGSNKIAYDITVDGTYYFVFSSDNEIVLNDLFFNLTFDKVVYDTSDNLANCTGASNCSLSLGFWSDDKTVVEVPATEKWDDSFVLRTNCEPRVAVYLCLLLLVPILIMFCAFQ